MFHVLSLLLLSSRLVYGAIYACFLFFKETLKVRFEDINHFVLVESTQGFTGREKGILDIEDPL